MLAYVALAYTLVALPFISLYNTTLSRGMLAGRSVVT